MQSNNRAEVTVCSTRRLHERRAPSKLNDSRYSPPINCAEGGFEQVRVEPSQKKKKNPSRTLAASPKLREKLALEYVPEHTGMGRQTGAPRRGGHVPRGCSLRTELDGEDRGERKRGRLPKAEIAVYTVCVDDPVWTCALFSRWRYGNAAV
ncbi:uncharacterized protein BT62DRAFT_936712 [Guyanagaster necrorhizus]|uniref:Uncharacterized protein n=1 Tax=Guyanagaster necrorhizus TaxID=856835 RepID=A0A9P8ANG9_9AGAR|nr:uncharacterized protein BT62DRAFT_936712 [Guyanagaster necrorhizus MCA 3950]KAG7441829.1 hypothetical protein BT62DRAFT_936712 [Guyanagaster necrorhizus MCA 3950]